MDIEGLATGRQCQTMITTRTLFLALAIASSAMAQTPAPNVRFRKLDRNGDGKIAPDELGMPVLFKVADKNADGAISPEEFTTYINTRRSGRGSRSQEAAPTAESVKEIEVWYAETPGVEGNPNWPRSVHFGEYHGDWYGHYSSRMVTDGRWKLVWNLTDLGELYDLEKDPHELRNRFYDPDCRSTRAHYFQVLREEAQRLDDAHPRLYQVEAEDPIWQDPGAALPVAQQ